MPEINKSVYIPTIGGGVISKVIILSGGFAPRSVAWCRRGGTTSPSGITALAEN